MQVCTVVWITCKKSMLDENRAKKPNTNLHPLPEKTPTGVEGEDSYCKIESIL